jgi:hypothetical protein
MCPLPSSPTSDKITAMKGSFYEALEGVFDKFPKYPRKILLGDLNAEVGKDDIFKPTTVSESLHEISNNNGVRAVNITTSKKPHRQTAMFPHHNIHKFTWRSPDGKTIQLTYFDR